MEAHMKLYDISQEVFTSAVYPGDPKPRREVLRDFAQGDTYHLTAFSMCAHNGTHVDAPAHFLQAGDTVEKIPLEKTVGYCFVAESENDIDAARAAEILAAAGASHPEAAVRILLKGKGQVLAAGAAVFAAKGVLLLGVEGQTVGAAEVTVSLHRTLLSAGVVLLEGLRLQAVPEGVYLLCAAPLLLGGGDGAPCRAVLIEV